MSEKEVREAAERMLTEGTTTIWSSEWERKGQDSPQGQLRKALAQPADLVVLLQKIVELHAIARDVGATAYSAVRCETLWDVIEEIQKTVRLTADGWEWVEGGDDES